jgi:hypothetical protein
MSNNDPLAAFVQDLEREDIKDVIKKVMDHGVRFEERIAGLLVLRRSDLQKAEKAQIVNYLLQDQSKDIRFWASIHAGVLGNINTVALLWSMLDGDDDESTKRMALTSLSELVGAAIIPTIIEMIWSNKARMRQDALALLSRFSGKETIEALENVVKHHSDSSSKFDAALYLAFMGNKCGQSVLLEKKIVDCSDRIAVSCALCKLGNSEGLVSMKRLLDNIGLLTQNHHLFLCDMLEHRLGFTGDRQQIIENAKQWVERELGM